MFTDFLGQDFRQHISNCFLLLHDIWDLSWKTQSLGAWIILIILLICLMMNTDYRLKLQLVLLPRVSLSFHITCVFSPHGDWVPEASILGKPRVCHINFYDLTLEVMWYHFCYVLFIKLLTICLFKREINLWMVARL